MSEVGKRVAELRVQAGLSQEDLGVKAGLHGMSVSKIERGIHEPKLSTLVALSEALGVEVDDLLAAPPDAGEQSGAAAAEVRAPQAASGAAASGLDAAAAPASTQRRAAS